MSSTIATESGCFRRGREYDLATDAAAQFVREGNAEFVQAAPPGDATADLATSAIAAEIAAARADAENEIAKAKTAKALDAVREKYAGDAGVFQRISDRIDAEPEALRPLLHQQVNAAAVAIGETWMRP